jgi:hypothetical protein
MRKIFLFVLLLPLSLVAQELTVKGKVIDEESKQPLPGVVVLIKNSAKGTTTNFDGEFEIETKKGDKLVFSFIGMKTQEVTVS